MTRPNCSFQRGVVREGSTNTSKHSSLRAAPPEVLSPGKKLGFPILGYNAGLQGRMMRTFSHESQMNLRRKVGQGIDQVVQPFSSTRRPT